MSILITFLLAVTKYLTRSYIMERFILAPFGSIEHQGRDRNDIVAGAAPAVEAGRQGCNSWKYQEAERRQCSRKFSQVLPSPVVPQPLTK